MEKIGNRRYVVVYFNADTPLGLFPNNTFFLDAHSALHPNHRQQMKVGYRSFCHNVHPFVIRYLHPCLDLCQGKACFFSKPYFECLASYLRCLLICRPIAHQSEIATKT